ncbi:hypothetical protein [Fibrobacter sp.]
MKRSVSYGGVSFEKRAFLKGKASLFLNFALLAIFWHLISCAFGKIQALRTLRFWQLLCIFSLVEVHK